MALWDDRNGVPELPKDLLFIAKSSSEQQPGNHRHTSTRPSSMMHVTTKPTAEDPLQMLARSRRPDVEAAGQRVGEQQDMEAVARAAQLTRAETLERFVVDQLPTRATSQLTPDLDTQHTEESAPGQRQGRLQAKIVAREEVESITWYTIKVNYDGIERDCRKRYNDFLEFDKYLRSWFPCLKEMLPELPSSGVVGLRHKLDLGSFNHRRQLGLERFLEIAVQTAGEQPVRRFLLSKSASDKVTLGCSSSKAKASTSQRKETPAKGGC